MTASPAQAATGPVRAERCTVFPVVAASMTATPWPQQRYDYPALRRIATGNGIVVAVIDSGVDARHPQLADHILAGTDLLDGGDGRTDCLGHGTAVASVIAASDRSGAGLAGLAPKASILPVRITERTEADATVGGRPASPADVATAIRYAVAHRAGVINLSLSMTRDDPRVRRAVEEALAADVVIVAAVGNLHEHGDPTPYPATYPGVIGVGAVTRDTVRVPSSQVGTYVDVMAPGDSVVGAVPPAGHARFSGTSLAAAFVAATAALIREHRPEWGQARVAAQIITTADPAPSTRPSAAYGYGVLNPMRALTELSPERSVASQAGVSPAGSQPALEARPATGNAGAVLAVLASVGTLAVLGVGAALPAGRRRRWRPARQSHRSELSP